MRGKVLREGLREHRLRITPAYAGKSEEIDRDAEIQRDHPRICGEKARCAAATTLQRGSPPHMRGKGRYFLCTMPTVGITPAYAGKRSSFSGFLWASWDHPRICGEKLDFAVSFLHPRGSPPHMRGKVPHCGCSNFHLGITPAYAGKRHHGLHGHSNEGDHPRICGEKR